MFWRMLALENQRLFRSRVLWIGLPLVMIPMAIMVPLFTGAEGYDRFLWPESLIPVLEYSNGYAMTPGNGLYLILIMAAVVMGQDYSWRTIQLWLGHGISRPTLLIARTLSLLLIPFAVTLAFLIVGACISFIASLGKPSTLTLADVNLWQLLLSIVRTSITMLPYVTLTMFIAVLTRSTFIALGVVAFFVMVVELPLYYILPLLGDTAVQAGEFLPAALGKSLVLENVAMVGLSVEHTSTQFNPWITTLLLVGYTIIFFLLALWQFQRQDIH